MHTSYLLALPIDVDDILTTSAGRFIGDSELGCLSVITLAWRIPVLVCSQYPPWLNIFCNSRALMNFTRDLVMSYSLDFNIRKKLAEYLAGKISLDEFEDWFFPETIEVDQESPLALIKLVYGIKLSLAEFGTTTLTGGA